MEGQQHYDTIILGGGLAGLTLAMQLKQQNADINVLVLESAMETLLMLRTKWVKALLN
jgi:2-polyprenyl-6-methoxyphenol hydroxylase-like FAD-dependent oxidoreductase